MAALALCLSMSVFGTAFAAEETTDAYSTSDWRPHGYIADIYDIPTTMTYDGAAGTVSFEGSLNAGIATTGFTCTAPNDMENFSITFSIDQLQDYQDISWMSFGLFDVAKASDGKSVKDVYAPFNAGNYQTSPFTGIILQLLPQGEGVFDFFAMVTKRINPEDGTFLADTWTEYPTEHFVSTINLDSKSDQNIKLSVTADEGTGLIINLNDGAWTDENGDRPGKINLEEDFSAVRTYFNENNKDAYFQFATMYKQGDHRYMKYTVSELNGKKACDGTAPSYLEAKSFEEGSVKTIITSDSVGNCGLYPEDVDQVVVTKFDSEDGDYAAVEARAQSLGMEILDYFRVVPQIGETNMKIGAPFTVEYTLPEGYTEYKAYYVNTDEEVVSIPGSLATVENGKATISVDNSTVNKIVIYGAKQSETSTDPGTNGGGCGGSAVALLSAISMVGVAVLIKKMH